jgi:lysyl-tRNA synthetase class 2
VNLFDFLPGYDEQIFQSGREPIFVTLLAYLITFALTRTYTRLARIYGWGSASAGGVHVHHIVVGIVFVLAAGVFLIGFQPGEGFWQLLLCALFGVGAAFILDEFALVLRLEDVYWSNEGRESVDAVAISVVIGGLVLLHVVPFESHQYGDESRWIFIAYVLYNLAAVVVALLKGKLMTGLVGLFVPFVALVGAVRLAKPTSLWARRFYGPTSTRRRRAEARYASYGRHWDERRHRLEDLVGGAPTAASPDAEPEGQ